MQPTYKYLLLSQQVSAIYVERCRNWVVKPTSSPQPSTVNGLPLTPKGVRIVEKFSEPSALGQDIYSETNHKVTRGAQIFLASYLGDLQLAAAFVCWERRKFVGRQILCYFQSSFGIVSQGMIFSPQAATYGWGTGAVCKL